MLATFARWWQYFTGLRQLAAIARQSSWWGQLNGGFIKFERTGRRSPWHVSGNLPRKSRDSAGKFLAFMVIRSGNSHGRPRWWRRRWARGAEIRHGGFFNRGGSLLWFLATEVREAWLGWSVGEWFRNGKGLVAPDLEGKELEFRVLRCVEFKSFWMFSSVPISVLVSVVTENWSKGIWIEVLCPPKKYKIEKSDVKKSNQIFVKSRNLKTEKCRILKFIKPKILKPII